MGWRERCGAKLVPLEMATKHIRSGDTVAVAPFTTTPFTLCKALIELGRKGGLERVRIEHLAALVCWTEPDLKGVFELLDNYATPANRAACHAGEMDYLPIGVWKSYELPAGVSWKYNGVLPEDTKLDSILSSVVMNTTTSGAKLRSTNRLS